MRIGLDAMGGDKAPGCTVKGAVDAVNEYGYHLTLFGDESKLRQLLSGYTYPSEKVKVINCTENIEMDDAD